MPQPKGFTQVICHACSELSQVGCIGANYRFMPYARLSAGQASEITSYRREDALASHIMLQLQSNGTGPPAVAGTMGQPNSVRTAQ